jgi:hypothetical protein
MGEYLHIMRYIQHLDNGSEKRRFEGVESISIRGACEYWRWIDCTYDEAGWMDIRLCLAHIFVTYALGLDILCNGIILHQVSLTFKGLPGMFWGMQTR